METVKGYMNHERGTLEAVTKARAAIMSAKTPQESMDADNMLTGALKTLFAVAESYPDLKANQNFLQLQDELTHTEDKIAYSRQHFNDSVLNVQQHYRDLPRKYLCQHDGEESTRNAANPGSIKRSTQSIILRSLSLFDTMEQQPRLIEDHIRKNKRDTVVICMFMVILLFSVIFAIGLLLGAPPILTMMHWVTDCVVLYFYYLFVFRAKRDFSSRSTTSKPTESRRKNPYLQSRGDVACRRITNTKSLCAGYSPDINAFATGHKPSDSIICATTGALQQLNTDELEGVIGHEMSHIRNRDILVMTVTVGVVGAIALLAEIALRMLFWGGAGRGGGKKGEGNIIIVVIAIIFIILAPIFSRLTYLAISRKREYLADADGAYLTRNPEGLAKALEKIKADFPDDPKGSKTVAPLYIANPFKRALRESIWSTHPPIDERIRRLRSM